MSFSGAVGTIVRRYFVSGLLVVVPLIITYLVLKALFQFIDGILQPLIVHLVGFEIPGLGLVTTLVLVIVAGLLTHNFIGSTLYGVWESVLARVPVIRPVYSAAKSLIESTTTSSAGSFKEVVMIEYPRKGIFVIGFVAHRLETEIEGTLRRCASVFVPSPPTPFTGVAVVVPVEEVCALDMTIEQALKFVVSGGVVAPDLLRKKGMLQWNPPREVTNETR